MIEFIFWLTFAAVVYGYVGYPVCLWVVSVFLRKPVGKKMITPRVSVVISAFNEEVNIEKKLKNLLSQDYPIENMEVLIGSDGASDNTDAIVSKFSASQVRLFRFVRNLGKPQVINSLVREARGQILIFTDARQEFEPDVIQNLVSNFADETVGCVSGELYFRSDESVEGKPIAQGMGAYWAYEKFLRRKESEIGSMLGATGAIYAIRRKLYEPIPSNILVDDMYIPLQIVAKGFRAIFESEAKAYDKPSEKGEQEFTRKVRTLVGNYQIFSYFSYLLNPGKSPVAIQLFSHKMMRVLIPFFLILLLVVNFFLVLSPFYMGFLVAQVLFYGLAGFEATQKSEKKAGIGYLPYTFCLLNFSAFVAFFKYIKGDYKAAWEKAY